MSSLTSSLTSSITEQLSASSKSQLETQLNFFNTVLRKSVENVQQVTTLNINTAKNVLERSTTSARELLEAKDPREVLSLAARPLPTVEGLLSYGRELYGIASRAQVDLLQSASDQFRATASKTLALTTANVGKATEDVAAASQTVSEAVAQAASQATTQAVEATRQVVTQTAEAANAAVHQAGEATQHVAEHVAQHVADSSEQVVQSAAPVVEAARNNAGQVAATATDNVEQATAAIAAAVADAAPVTPAAETAEAPEAATAPKTMRGRPAAKPVAEALSAVADKGAASLKSVPNSGKSQPRK